MTVKSHIDNSQDAFVISIEGKFDFHTHNNFRNSYEYNENKFSKYIVDLSETTSIDSSALGMLLLLRDYAGGKGSNVEIHHSGNDVTRILELSNFESLFTLKEIA